MSLKKITLSFLVLLGLNILATELVFAQGTPVFVKSTADDPLSALWKTQCKYDASSGLFIQKSITRLNKQLIWRQEMFLDSKCQILEKALPAEYEYALLLDPDSNIYLLSYKNKFADQVPNYKKLVITDTTLEVYSVQNRSDPLPLVPDDIYERSILLNKCDEGPCQ